MKQIIKLMVNGAEQESTVQTHHTLLEVLRRDFKLFGAREGCGIGMCGACTGAGLVGFILPHSQIMPPLMEIICPVI